MSKISRRTAIERWKTADGIYKRGQIINSLLNNKPIEKLPFIEQIDGYYDLRGIYFENKTILKKVEIKNIDFSYSNFNCLLLDQCRIENIIFDMCDCVEMVQYGCYFEKCRFTKTKFLNAGFGIDGGKYKNILFEESNFEGAFFYYPDFEDCTFMNCKMEGVDFSASHLIDVKFIGKLDDVWFRGESPIPKTQKKMKETGRGLNPMIVDFADADLWFITFSDHCDLSRVIMPKDGEHYLINNIKKVIQYLEVDAEKIIDMKHHKFVKEFIAMYKSHIVKQDMVIINFKELISNAQYYMGKESTDYCKGFIDKLIILSHSGSDI